MGLGSIKNEPEGIEELMPWSDKMKRLCAIDTKARMEIQRYHGSQLARSANIERLRGTRCMSSVSAHRDGEVADTEGRTKKLHLHTFWCGELV